MDDLNTNNLNSTIPASKYSEHLFQWCDWSGRLSAARSWLLYTGEFTLLPIERDLLSLLKQAALNLYPDRAFQMCWVTWVPSNVDPGLVVQCLSSTAVRRHSNGQQLQDVSSLCSLSVNSRKWTGTITELHTDTGDKSNRPLCRWRWRNTTLEMRWSYVEWHLTIEKLRGWHDWDVPVS